MAARKKMASKGKAPRTKPGELSKYQAFVMQRMRRCDIKNAPYNPRVIQEHNRSRLELILKGMGLLHPVTVNGRNGNLVGGHKRLSILDALEGHDQYELDVAVVDLTDVQEREANVALNNGAAQGDFEMQQLADILKTPGLDLEMTGFVPMDLEMWFDDPELGNLFEPDAQTATEMAALQEFAPPKKPRVQKEAKRAERKEWDEGFAEKEGEAIYAVVVFQTYEDRSRFFDLVGHPADERHIDAQLVLARMTKAKAPRKSGN